MMKLSRRRRILLGFVILLIGGAYANKVISSGVYGYHPPVIDANWVRQFIGNVSSITRIRFVENSTLDTLAKERFQTAVLVPTITHFGASTELPQGVGEVIYYPSGFSPEGMVQSIELFSPRHWALMSTSGFTQYGYYLGTGPTIILNEGCREIELPGPNINVTQYFQKYGCTITWVTSSWLVIDMSK
jgi:hypothetical protein